MEDGLFSEFTGFETGYIQFKALVKKTWFNLSLLKESSGVLHSVCILLGLRFSLLEGTPTSKLRKSLLD